MTAAETTSMAQEMVGHEDQQQHARPVLDESSRDFGSLLLLARAAGKASASEESEEAIATNLRSSTYG